MLLKYGKNTGVKLMHDMVTHHLTEADIEFLDASWNDSYIHQMFIWW